MVEELHVFTIRAEYGGTLVYVCVCVWHNTHTHIEIQVSSVPVFKGCLKNNQSRCTQSVRQISELYAPHSIMARLFGNMPDGSWERHSVVSQRMINTTLDITQQYTLSIYLSTNPYTKLTILLILMSVPTSNHYCVHSSMFIVYILSHTNHISHLVL